MPPSPDAANLFIPMENKEPTYQPHVSSSTPQSNKAENVGTPAMSSPTAVNQAHNEKAIDGFLPVIETLAEFAHNVPADVRTQFLTLINYKLGGLHLQLMSRRTCSEGQHLKEVQRLSKVKDDLGHFSMQAPVLDEIIKEKLEMRLADPDYAAIARKTYHLVK
ncbi:MAG: hypothetical protein L6R41_006377 [Letrouitia leprolyta]|nr:MAG: hypothetical protein L6R41_006377 [Letrouitia leprolyta]